MHPDVKVHSNSSSASTKLSILWIDDNPDILPHEIGLYSNYWDIVQVMSVAGLNYLLDKSEIDFPFDVYVCDFRMVSKAVDRDARQTIPEFASAAGLLMGIFCTMRWPNSPQALLPYSGEPTEFGATYSLVRELKPKATTLLDENLAERISLNPMTKTSHSVQNVLEYSAKIFRQALRKSYSAGFVQFLGEMKRNPLSLLKMVETEAIQPSYELEISSVSGVRKIQLSSLFFDLLSGRGDKFENYLEISSYISSFKHDDIYLQARKIATNYFRWYSGVASREMYLSWNVYKEETGTRMPQFSDAGPGYPITNDIQNDNDTLKLLRLSMLCLLHERRKIALGIADQIIQSDDKNQNSIDDFDFMTLGHEGQILKMDFEEAQEFSDKPITNLEDYTYLLYVAPEEEKFDIARLLHPMPKQRDLKPKAKPEELRNIFNKAGNIAASTGRIPGLGFITNRSVGITNLPEYAPLELIRQFALEIGLTQDYWPRWLKKE